MSATTEPPATAAVERPRPAAQPALARAEGLQLIGEMQGSGYREGAALARRADGQMVHLGPLMYALLCCMDGRRSVDELAEAMCERLGRGCDPEHVVALAEKLAAQGLLAGTEANAPPRSNPLLGLRWKVLLTDPGLTRRLTAPFLFLFRPWVLVPVLVAFLAVFWVVAIREGVAGATAQAFESPELLLLVFGLAVASAAFHELGHATACRYGGATPSGMGAGIYMVWPAFYTDVTDAYRLPRRDRLRVDLGGLFFNALVAVAVTGVWLATGIDALLLLVALQLVQMVQQLSPIIRADGYHILADATGVPDLYAHIGPTLRRLLPWRRNEPSALTGRARLLVTAWVLVVVPILLALTISALLLFPRIAASAWESGRQIADGMGDGGVADVLLGALRLVALALPVLGVVLMVQTLLRRTALSARTWSAGHPVRRVAVVGAGTALVAAAAWAWWPSGQYQPIRASEEGTLMSLARSVAAPASSARPAAPAPAPAAVALEPGRHLAVALIPEGGATEERPALYVIEDAEGTPTTVLASDASPAVPASTATATEAPAAAAPAEASAEQAPPAAETVPATAFPFDLPAPPGEGDTQALAVNTEDGSVKYTVAYALVTVRDGEPADNANSAFALASCEACTTVAVSFQVVLIVGHTRSITPINVAGALNADCPACITTAIADQIVVTLDGEPSPELLAALQTELDRLGALPDLGIEGTPEEIATRVLDVHRRITAILQESGTLASESETEQAEPTPTTTQPAETTTTPTSTTAEPAPTTSTTAEPAPAEPTSTTPSEPTATTPAEPTTTTTTTTTTAEPAPEPSPEPEPAAEPAP